MMRTRPTVLALFAGATALTAAACGTEHSGGSRAAPPRVAGTVYVVQDTTIETAIDAAGVARPVREATLSTKLMGRVTAVLALEGSAVGAGQPLVRIDARDVAAKEEQVAAAIAEAEAVQRDAATQAARFRSLYSDSAATRAQLDAVETGLARATAAVSAARASAAEVGAMSSYALIRAPFSGTVVRRFVDPGAFAAPGAPLLTVQDASRLRIAVQVAPDAVRSLHTGSPVTAAVEGTPVTAIVEGIVPTAGNLYTVNAIVPNAGHRLPAGGTATLSIPQGRRTAIVVPASAMRRQGDLTGVTVRTASGDETRWIRTGRTSGGVVEVYAGLVPGDRVVVPAPARVAAE